MANNKYAGYTPAPSKEKRKEGTTEVENRLDRFNPYEFRKGMDYELTSLGCTRLAESTIEEREKSTENVLKNLEEHQAYYSALIQFEGGMKQGGKINESSFKKYLETYTGTEGRGDGMVCVKKETKDDKMTEPKYDKTEYTKEFKTDLLKEAIKREINKIVSEGRKKKDKEAADDTYQDAFNPKAAKDLTAKMEELEQEKKDKTAEKAEYFATWKKDTAAAAGDPDKKAAATEKYSDKGTDLQNRIKDIDKDLKGLEDQLLGVNNESKMARREIAKSMMEKDVHMEILNIIQEAGVSLREGADGVKMYYEIAKTAYMEGLTAGLKQ